jgi:hypothetical protein
LAAATANGDAVRRSGSYSESSTSAKSTRTTTTASARTNIYSAATAASNNEVLNLRHASRGNPRS